MFEKIRFLKIEPKKLKRIGRREPEFWSQRAINALKSSPYGKGLKALFKMAAAAGEDPDIISLIPIAEGRKGLLALLTFSFARGTSTLAAYLKYDQKAVEAKSIVQYCWDPYYVSPMNPRTVQLQVRDRYGMSGSRDKIIVWSIPTRKGWLIDFYACAHLTKSGKEVQTLIDTKLWHPRKKERRYLPWGAYSRLKAAAIDALAARGVWALKK